MTPRLLLPLVALLVGISGCKPDRIGSRPHAASLFVPSSNWAHVACTLSAIAVEPDRDRLRYLFDCEDGTTELSDFVPNGTRARVTHAWSGSGVFHVRALAQDEYGNCSDWSDPDSIAIQGYPDRVVAKVRVGRTPGNVAVLPNGEFAYIVDSDTDCVYVIRTSDCTVVDTISVGSGPCGIAAAPNGDFVYVACHHAGSIAKIRTADNAVVARIPSSGGPYSVAVLPDGSHAYVAGWYSGALTVIRCADDSVVATVEVGDQAFGVAAAADGKYVYVTSDRYWPAVSVIRTTDNRVIKELRSVGHAFSTAASPTGDYVYFSSGDGGAVTMIRTSDNTIAGAIRVNWPRGLAVLPEGRLFCVATGDNRVLVIDKSDSTVVRSIPVGNSAYRVAASADGQRVYVTCTGDRSLWVIGR